VITLLGAKTFRNGMVELRLGSPNRPQNRD
jgi:hypothetical protein